MRISVNCPSYRRPEVKTLNYIDFCNVYVDEKEYNEYKEKNPGAKIIKCKNGVQGNVARVRNYILDQEFGKGMDAVCIIDDDLSGIYRFNEGENHFGYKKRKIEQKEFMEFLQKNSELCKDLGFRLWGVNCNGDALSYRQYTPFSFSSIILGPFCVHIKNEIRYDEKLPLKEDYDLAIQHLNKYRGILRLNMYHYICEQSTNTGGCAMIRNLKKEKEQFEMLQEKWGSQIVKEDRTNKGKTKKIKRFDYNPIIKVPINGV